MNVINDKELTRLLNETRPLMPAHEHWAGLGEEGSELCQAALKMRRVLTQINRTPVTREDALLNVIEEIADVYNYIDFLEIREDAEMMAAIEEIRKNKLRRMLAERYKQ